MVLCDQLHEQSTVKLEHVKLWMLKVHLNINSCNTQIIRWSKGGDINKTRIVQIRVKKMLIKLVTTALQK